MQIERAAHLAALKQHPSWAALTAEIEETKEKYLAGVTKILLSTGQLPDTFEFKRGFLAGMEHLARYPEGATKILEREANRVKQTEGNEVD